MNKTVKTNGKRMTALMLVLVLVVSMFSTTAFAAQEDNYHDPAEHWLNAANRTNELDANAVVTHETFNCAVCGASRSFKAWRTPEYTRNGQTAMTRNVRYSDGTLVGGEGTGAVMDGLPGVNAYYTGYHWTKACCETCGTMNSNMGMSDYSFGKNVYWLYDCAPEFTEELPEQVKYEYTDSTYHTKTTKGGSYCCFCFGTNHTSSSKLERHNMQAEIIPQISNDRFAIVKHCVDCEYTSTNYVAAKSVIADYYGVVDGQPHTVTISDLSEAGVSTQIRYGNSAESCTLTSAPNYTEKGQYNVYYEITYTYSGKTMTENGVAKVWLHDEKEDTDCPCGCGDPDCDCKNPDCNGSCHKHNCGDNHNFESLAFMTSTDELDLPSLGEKKVALFALIPDNDSSFNFLVSILYTQLFQQLFYSADHVHGGALPVPVHFLMDEFANVSLPDDFDKILSVMRSRGVSVSIILQNLAQLKALFEKQWESIVGNCDEFLYLGGNEQSTHKYVSELLGKETIDTNTFGKSSGRSGNYSTNYQISGRELLTPDEVRMLDNQYAILFIRGERPVLDFKYDILKHPNVALTADGKADVYRHGEVTDDVATISVEWIDPDDVPEMELTETNFELLSDEDFEAKQ